MQEQFPSDTHLAALRRRYAEVGWKRLTQDEHWMRHGYDYAWRRVQLGDKSDRSVIDPDGVWFDASYVRMAEVFWRRKLGIHVLAEPARVPDDVVRTNWREIPSPQLTAAERALSEPEMARMSATAKRAIAAAEERWEAMKRGRAA